MQKLTPSKRAQIADLAKQIANHQANLQTIGANWGEQINAHLSASERLFLKKMKPLLDNFEFQRNAADSLKRLKVITDKLNEIRANAYQRAWDETFNNASELAENEIKWSKKVSKELSEQGTKFDDPTQAAIDKTLKNGIADGQTLRGWFDKIQAEDAGRLDAVIRQGIASGWTIDQLTRSIAGTAANDYQDGLFATSKREANTIARTMCNSVANQAKETFYQANSDVIVGVEWLDTLDGRTCVSCASLSGKRWKLDEPHPTPPEHPNCRCVLLPVTPLTDLVDEERPQANADFQAEAKRNYEAKFPKKSYSDLSESTRKKYYHEAIHEYEDRTGKSAFSTVSGSVTFKDYFLQMSTQQQKDWLGAEKYEIWKRGNLPLNKFIPPYPNKKLTVKRLKELDKKSFDK